MTHLVVCALIRALDALIAWLLWPHVAAVIKIELPIGYCEWLAICIFIQAVSPMTGVPK